MTNTPQHDAVDLAALAVQLAQAKRERRALEPLLARYPALSAGDAYRVAAVIRDTRVSAGERIAGRKIGLTNTTAWQAMETDAPIWGYVYDSTLVMATNGAAEVDLARAVAPRIEPEIGFKFRKALDPARADLASILDAVEWVAPCFEIIDSHLQWKFKAVEGIADFGVHYALVVGTPLEVTEANRSALMDALRDCTVDLRKDGADVAQGRGANTLGHPLAAVAGMLGVMAAHGMPPVAAGEIVTTGTLTPAFDIAAGQEWAATFGGIALRPLRLRLR